MLYTFPTGNWFQPCTVAPESESSSTSSCDYNCLQLGLAPGCQCGIARTSYSFQFGWVLLLVSMSACPGPLAGQPKHTDKLQTLKLERVGRTRYTALAACLAPAKVGSKALGTLGKLWGKFLLTIK